MHGLVGGSGVGQRVCALLKDAADACRAGKQQSVFSSLFFLEKLQMRYCMESLIFLKLNKTFLEMQTKKPCVGQEIASVSRIPPLGSQCACSNIELCCHSSEISSCNEGHRLPKGTA